MILFLTIAPRHCVAQNDPAGHCLEKPTIETNVVVETTRLKTGKIFRDLDQSFFETFGSRPRPEITKTETGNYSTSKNRPKSISPSLIDSFFIFP